MIREVVKEALAHPWRTLAATLVWLLVCVALWALCVVLWAAVG